MPRKLTATPHVKALLLKTPAKSNAFILKDLMKRFGPGTDTNRSEAKLVEMIKFYATRLNTLGEIPDSVKAKHVAPHGRIKGSKNVATLEREAKEGVSTSKAKSAPAQKSKAAPKKKAVVKKAVAKKATVKKATVKKAAPKKKAVVKSAQGPKATVKKAVVKKKAVAKKGKSKAAK